LVDTLRSKEHGEGVDSFVSNQQGKGLTDSLAKKSQKYPGGEGSNLKLDITQNHGTK
jgi:hypothetical protein